MEHDKVSKDFIEFKTANTAATHLGRKLYDSSPSAIAELVANSYDAYATQVNIKIDKGSTHIVVADDGMGMCLESLQDTYAQIGQAKTPLTAPQNMAERKSMGKKGIGKLASFSLGDQFTIYTRDAAKKEWLTFTVKYSDMIDQENWDNYKAPYSTCAELPKGLCEYGKSTGFIVVIENLRRKITKSTVDNLISQLVRRFSLATDNFEIFVNSKKVRLSHKECLYQHVQALNYVGYTEEQIKADFPESCEVKKYTPKKENGDDFRDLVDDSYVKAWVGVVDKPKRLKEIGLGGIVVYINGKIADEDLLKGEKSAQMGGQYVTGEVYADYLNDRDEEPITSSRQGLDHSDEEVEKLVRLARAMESRAITQWGKLSVENAKDVIPESISSDEKYISWRESLSTVEKKFHDRLLKTLKIQVDMSDPEQHFTDTEKTVLMNSFTTVVGSVRELGLVSQLDSTDVGINPQEFMKLFGELLGKIATQDKLQMAATAQSRLEAIRKLEELEGKDKELEKTFEEHLSENPWLLNPFWNPSPDSDESVQVRRQKFTKIKEESGNTGYIDIYVEVAEEKFPVIVELKRADGTGHSSPSKVTRPNIIAQISKYRKGLWDSYSPTKRAEAHEDDINAIFIAPQSAFNSSTMGLTEEDVTKLKDTDRITVCTYQDLINDARASYQEFFKASNIFDRLPYYKVDFGVNDDSEQ